MSLSTPTRCCSQRSCCLSGHGVDIVINCGGHSVGLDYMDIVLVQILVKRTPSLRSYSLYKDTTMTKGRDIYAKFWRGVIDFKGSIRQYKVYLGVLTRTIAIIGTFENRGLPYLRLNFHIRIVVDFAETQILIFAIKYVCQNKKFHETDLTRLKGPRYCAFRKK